MGTFGRGGWSRVCGEGRGSIDVAGISVSDGLPGAESSVCSLLAAPPEVSGVGDTPS